MNMPRPVSYHNRTGQVLPENKCELQKQVNKLNTFVSEMDMRINQEKSKVMLFNTARTYDFMPSITIDGINNMEVVEEMKLLGIIFQSNMKWYANTSNLCHNGYGRLWMLRNLKKHGAGINDLLDVYIKQCRCVLELAAPVWSGGITEAESNQIERVQKAAFSIILGKNYISYRQAMNQLRMQTLKERRRVLCLNFARKSEEHEKFQNWFEPNDDPTTTNTYKPVTFRTKRYKNSPLPYLTSLLNGAQ